MKIILNGTEEVCPGHESLTDLLNRKETATDRLVIEQNGLIVPRDEWARVQVRSGDTIEVIRLVGGG